MNDVMSNKKLYEILDEYGLGQHLELAFNNLGMHSRTVLADDQKVKQAAKFAYEALPFLLRTVIHSTIGEEGFIKLVFQVRNGMLENNKLDLSWLNQEKIKAALPNHQILVHQEQQYHQPPQQASQSNASTQNYTFSGNDKNAGSISFSFPCTGATSPISGVIGRDPNQCQFAISLPSISRVHARLKYLSGPEGSGIGLCDLGSSYGTYLDGHKLDNSFKLLPQNARVEFGGFKMTAIRN
jgi:FHA domain